ncbi:OsmC family protein [Alloalcanivorax mobilis]|uniref:OsmC family protein n=1 Tax=Alloalcanivorax mobilis TaxID=2019569 RepID=UPI000C782A62|nr:OsmC family protein [Alloalcanivorax mobilis]
MKAVVQWQGEACFQAESESGHTVVMDGPPDHGGHNRGPRPMETLLIGVGGCSSFDVVHILGKSRQDVTDCRCEISAERADDQVPAVFTKIHLHFVVSGNNLKEAQVKRAVELSAEKYCSASIMLARGGVDITHSYSIEDSQP